MEEALEGLRQSSQLLHAIQDLDAQLNDSTTRMSALQAARAKIEARVLDMARRIVVVQGALETIATQGFVVSVAPAELVTASVEVDACTRIKTEAEKALNEANALLESCRSEWRSANHALQQGGAGVSSTSETEILFKQEEVRRDLGASRNELEHVKHEIGRLGEMLAEHRRNRTTFAEDSARLNSQVRILEAERDVLAQTLDSLRTQARREDIDGDAETFLNGLEERALECSRQLAEIEAELGQDERAHERLQLVLKLSTLPDIETDLSAVRREAASVESQQSSLLRARTRLAAIGDAVRNALDAESISARNRFQVIIDAVMRVLSPHRHLNTIRIESTGGICLMDESLPNPVNAVRYSSSGQMNLIGLAVFLGVGLGTRGSKLQTVMLDEPVQNLDDVNILNFVDLVRGLARSHQVILSTADSNFVDLLRAKLGPWAVAEKKTVILHEFRDFDRQAGPIVRTHRARIGGELPGFE
jgi:hypothetical protein